MAHLTKQGEQEASEVALDKETSRRRDEVLRRMLSTPPKKHEDEKRPKDQPKPSKKTS